MLLRKRLHDSQAMMSFGTVCLAIGIVMQRFIHPPTDIWQGFVSGFSGTLIGVSVVFHLRGLMLWKKKQ